MSRGRDGRYERFIEDIVSWEDSGELYKKVGYKSKEDYMNKQDQLKRKGLLEEGSK